MRTFGNPKGETEACWKLSLQSQTGSLQTHKVAKIEF